MNLVSNKLLMQVCDIAKAVGNFIQTQASLVQEIDIETKWNNNFVSYVDKQAEAKIVQALMPLLPNASFIAEEETVQTDKTCRYKWIIDPLDGTTNFLRKVPCYAVSIGLMDGQEMVLGVVYEINRQECFYALKGGGAFLNGKPIRVSNTSNLQKSLLATGFPYYNFEVFMAYQQVLQYFMQHTTGLRRLGAASVDLCYVACGIFDGFWEHSLHAWDVAAACVIVKEAGGVICDFDGQNNYIFGQEIVASNPYLQQAFFAVITQHLGKPKTA